MALINHALIIRQAIQQGSSLEDVLRDPAFTSIVDDGSIDEAVRRFESDTFCSEEMASFGSEAKNVVLSQADDWFVSCSRRPKTQAFAYTPSGPFALAQIAGACDLVVDVYDVRGIRPDFPGDARATASFVERIRLQTGRIWTRDFRNLAFSIEPESESDIFLKVNGPVSVEYMHAFDKRDGSFMYSSFSRPEGTGAHLLSTFLRDLARDEHIMDSLRPSEVSAVRSIFRRILAAPSTPATAKWTALQGMGLIDPSGAQDHLSEIAMSDSPLAPYASAALEHDAKVNAGRAAR